jgi:glycosyltransferase
LFKTQLTYSADYELMLRFLFKQKISVSYLPKVIVKMRMGGVSNASLSNRLKANKEDREAWRLNQLQPLFFTHWLKPVRKIVQFMRAKKVNL